MEQVKLGQILETDPGRDAVHVAIAPVVAAEKLWGGLKVGLIGDGKKVGTNAKPIGIVDPFIEGPIRKGQMFYLWLFPNTVKIVL